MNPTEKLAEVVTRLSPEQYTRLLSFAEFLAAGTTAPLPGVALSLPESFPEPLRLRLRELTRKSEDETLSEAERTEYLALAEQRELADARRIESARQLSVAWDISIPEALTLA